MPFTPFHLGPALCLGIPLRKYIHAPTFILANVILDIEPLLVLTMGLNYPLHGYLHTFIAAVVVGVVFGLGMFFLERIMHPLYKTLLLEPEAKFKKTNFIIAGVLGTMLHVLFDSPLYFDIKPFYPLTVNPLYGSVSSLEIYLLSFWLGVLGVVFYLLLLIFKSYKRLRKNQSETPTIIKENTFKKDYLPSSSVSTQASIAKLESASASLSILNLSTNTKQKAAKLPIFS
jgi:hypothetical protein